MIISIFDKILTFKTTRNLVFYKHIITAGKKKKVACHKLIILGFKWPRQTIKHSLDCIIKYKQSLQAETLVMIKYQNMDEMQSYAIAHKAIFYVRNHCLLYNRTSYHHQKFS